MTTTAGSDFTSKLVDCAVCKGTGIYVYPEQICPTCAGNKVLTHCVECETNITPDVYTRVSAFRVYVKGDQRGQDYTIRNLWHDAAHKLVVANPGSAMQIDRRF